MNNDKIVENFFKCIDWCRESAKHLGNNPLYIGWGDDYFSNNHNSKIFENKEFSLRFNVENDVDIYTYGAYYMQTYGYAKEEIDRWVKQHEENGMMCPENRHTFSELSVGTMEKFLRDWSRIKEKIVERIDSVKSLDNFEV